MDNYYDKDKDFSNLTFADSWKDKEVELAATAAIIVGTAALARGGNSGQLKHYAGRAGKNVKKGFVNYVKKTGNPFVRQGVVLTDGVFESLKKGKVPSRKETLEEFRSKTQRFQKEVVDEKIENAYQKKLARKMSEYEAKIADAKAFGKSTDDIHKPDPHRIKEQVRQSMFEEKMNPQPKTKRKPWEDMPALNKKEVANNAVGSAIGGVGFGAGLTAFHAINDASSGENKKRDKSFSIAGSYHKKEAREVDEEMRKESGTREIYDSVAEFGKKIPSATATGIGFTGVSLGAASLLNKKKKEEEGAKGEGGNRIIIELGEDNPADRSNSGHTTPGGYGLLPRTEFGKTASANRFLSNLGGRGKETKHLKERMNDHDYNASAADSLRGQNVDGLAKERYGHIFEGDKAKEKLFDEQAKKLRANDQSQYEGIRNEVADARVKAMGGLGIIGLGAAGAAKMRGDEEHDAGI